jgi:hypothetical protein
MFPRVLPDAGKTVVSAGHAHDMADLFAIVGFATVSLLCVARWWEEH